MTSETAPTIDELSIYDLSDHFQTVVEIEEWLKNQSELTDRRLEIIAGKFVEKSGIRQEEIDLVDFLLRLFTKTTAYENQHSLIPEADSYVDDQRKRIPDLAYFMAEQRKHIRAGKKVATLFAIEILSENDTVEHFQRKVHDYFVAGAKLVWGIMPFAQQIYLSNLRN